MLADGELQRVPASRGQAERLLAQARVHVASALKVCDEDPPGGYALAYDGARKALTAVLENQGLRPTTRGGHLAALEAIRAQLDPPMGRVLRQFNRMRTRRHDAEYPPADSPEITAADVREDQATAEGLIGIATRLLEEMSPFRADPVRRAIAQCAANGLDGVLVTWRSTGQRPSVSGWIALRPMRDLVTSVPTRSWRTLSAPWISCGT
jgi:hypothetical protein